MKSKLSLKKFKENDTLSFLGMLALAYVLSLIPVIHWPFSWAETFFHEISHGITAVLSGGSIQRIELNLNGSGVCTSSGGIRFLVSFAGYAGAIFWGALIYCITDHKSEKRTDRIAYIILSLLALTALLWGKDFITLLILTIIAAPFVIVLKTKEIEAERRFMQLLGLYILLDALKSPTYLLDGESTGDSATLQNLTWIPEIIWIGIWLALGAAALFFLFKRHK